MKKVESLAALPKAAQKVARQYAAAGVRRAKDSISSMEMLNTGLGFGSSIGAAFIDHKFREGAESEARIGSQDSKFRPQVNSAIALGAIVAGVFGRKMLGKYAGTAVSIGQGFGGPALYAFTRKKLDEG